LLVDLDQRFREAVRSFWEARQRQQDEHVARGKIDAAARGAVSSYSQMGALEVLLVDIVLAAGLGPKRVHVRTALELPGYYRPEKKWDLLIVADGRLFAAIDLESQVGPDFEDTFNARAAECIGSAEDVWTAYNQGLFGKGPSPFVGYFLLTEDCAALYEKHTLRELYFPVDPVFQVTSYAQRYELLCTRLLSERKYSAACLAFVPENEEDASFPARSLSFGQFATALDAHARAFAQGPS
jgi:hypothetical protein